ncbi:Glucanosyltransferase-domain-containing protein [Podospora fimiseda]|uniref:1,3-beta-glucanosyltransferase n=1 Tax=Podospora fimiseda TaxID=252190 RepID=A0AAN7H3Q1_9PEZI|nr:Glucanosyltransferase-domain-containing protein [Podospora fimiseda]
MLTYSAALLAFGATLAAAVQPLEVQNGVFVNPKTGNQFHIVGIAYQPGGSGGYNPEKKIDPLSDKDVCLRDAALMQILGINTIRVYNLNPDINHDECASIFNAAGMYMLLDVNSPLPGESLTSWEPWKSYYAEYLNRTFAVVEAFKNYPNTLAFFSGNEVMNNEETGATVPPYMRAVTRDVKNYVKKHVSRPIPVGYSAADVRDILQDSYDYLQCSLSGDKGDMSKGDLFALNSYSWCGESSFKEASYDELVEIFKNADVPIFFSEYGCNTPSPRVFTEVGTIHSSQMVGFSGGVVYEYTQEPNNYGLVNISASGPVTLLSDFYSLKAQYAKLDFKEVQGLKAPTTSKPKPPTCDSKLITTKGFHSNFTNIPPPPPGAQDIIDKGVSPKPSGKIVKISDWKVKFDVFNNDGTKVEGLAVKPLADDEINQPGSNTAVVTQGADSTAGGGSSSSGSTSGDSKDENSAPRSAATIFTALAMGAFAVMAGMI